MTVKKGRVQPTGKVINGWYRRENEAIQRSRIKDKEI